jgi:hypothetical protein
LCRGGKYRRALLAGNVKQLQEIGLNEDLLFIYFILQDSPHQTNIKLIQISTSALAGTDNRDKLQ